MSEKSWWNGSLLSALLRFQSGFLPRCYTVQNKLAAWSMSMNLCWYSDNATCGGARPLPRLNVACPCIFSASMSVRHVKTQNWELKGRVRFGTDSCASEGKESKQPPPPLRPCRCHSRDLFPRLTSVRNSSGIFPENFRKFFGTFRTFSVTSSAHYL